MDFRTVHWPYILNRVKNVHLLEHRVKLHNLISRHFRNMDSYEKILLSANEKCAKLVKRPEIFMDPNSDLFEDIKLLSKVRTLFKLLKL